MDNWMTSPAFHSPFSILHSPFSILHSQLSIVFPIMGTKRTGIAE